MAVADSTAERNAAVIRETIDAVWNNREWSASTDSYADDIIVHSPTQPEPYRGRDDFKRMWEDLTTAYSDFHMEIVDLFGAGNRSAVRFLVTGTNDGAYFGMPATGRSLDVEELAIFHFRDDGKISEVWFGLDSLKVGQQLGLIPEGPPPRALIAFMRIMQRLRRRKAG